LESIKISFKRSPVWKYIDPIVPALNALPKWYKDKKREVSVALPHERRGTMKACPAMFDSMTQGYIVPLWTDLYVEPSGNFINGIPIPQFYWCDGIEGGNGEPLITMFELEAIEGMPGADKINLPAFKIDSPWILTTPKGYSTLFVAPFNNRDIMFEAISGIIHTDLTTIYLNIPFLWTGPPDFKGVIKRGTPMVQLIPFKREEFEHELGFIGPEEDAEQLACGRVNQATFAGGYRRHTKQPMSGE